MKNLRTDTQQTQLIQARIDEYYAYKRTKKPFNMIYAVCAGVVAIPLLWFYLLSYLFTDNSIQQSGYESFTFNVAHLANHPSLPDVEVAEKLQILSWYTISGTGETSELFKTQYGIPEKTSEEDIFVFDLEMLPYEARYERLASRIASDDSPDMFPFEEKLFPVIVHQGMIAPIDEYIDFSGSEWDTTRDIMEKQFKFMGRHYVPVTELTDSTSLLFYRNSVITEYGLPDPLTLFRNNRWNWEGFEYMCRAFSDAGRGKYGVMGFYIDEAAILSTGLPLIGLNDNGLLTHNMDNRRIDRAMSLLKRLADSNLRYPYHEINEFRLDYNAFRDGNILFWNDGAREWEQRIRHMAHNGEWEDDDIGVVPFPRDPRSRVYFTRGNTDSLMLVQGAKNIDGFKAWTQCAVLVAQDETVQTQIRSIKKRDFGWTDSNLDVLDEIRKLDLLWDLKDGIILNENSGGRYSAVQSLTKPVIRDGVSYQEMRESERLVIENWIDIINFNLFMPRFRTLLDLMFRI
jgi:multiple sugar transport system substrate-binding protein